MQKTLTYLKFISPAVLRVGIALVIIWFGFQQLLHPQMWLSYVPLSVVSFFHLSANFLVHLNGAFEIVFGAAMLLGIRTRLSALLLALHMFDITYIVGYGAIGMRDLGLSFALLAIFMHGPSPFSFDVFKRNSPEDASIAETKMI
jgi:uncharacterized membrane protein YphA (DoxX/SURF4 family)